MKNAPTLAIGGVDTEEDEHCEVCPLSVYRSPRSGDELDSKIRKAEREIRALENTLAHLLTRNQKYKENFKKVDKRAEQQVLEKQQLDEQSRAANETLFKKKQLLAQIDKEFEEDSKRMEELQRQQNGLLDARGRAEVTIRAIRSGRIFLPFRGPSSAVSKPNFATKYIF